MTLDPLFPLPSVDHLFHFGYYFVDDGEDDDFAVAVKRLLSSARRHRYCPWPQATFHSTPEF